MNIKTFIRKSQQKRNFQPVKADELFTSDLENSFCQVTKNEMTNTTTLTRDFEPIESCNIFSKHAVVLSSIVILVWMFCPMLSNAQFRYVDGEDASYSPGQLTDNGRVYKWLRSGTGLDPLFDATYSRKGDHSIKVGAKSASSGAARSEVIFTPRSSEYYGNDDQWFGMSVRFPEGFSVPKSWFLFAQWWQVYPLSPPIALEMANNTEVPSMRLVLRASENTDEDGWVFTQVGDVEAVPLGEWMDFVVHWKCGPNGYVRVWTNGTLWREYIGPVGYLDKSKAIEVKWGVYRGKENTNQAVSINFDEIRLGNSYDEVNPAASVDPPNDEIVGIRNKSTQEYIWYKNQTLETKSLTDDQAQNWDSHRFEVVELTDGSHTLKHITTGEYLWYKSGSITTNALTSTQVQAWSSHKVDLISQPDGSVWIKHITTGEYLYGKSTGTLQFQGLPAASNNEAKWTINNLAGTPGARASSDDASSFKSVQEAIQNLPENRSLVIYPNPVAETLYIGGDKEISRVAIYSASDLLIQSEENVTGSVSTGQLPDGFYIVKLTDSEGVVHNKRLIKSK